MPAGVLLWAKHRVPRPDRRQVIVFVSGGRGSSTKAARAAAAVAGFGYSRCLVLRGGINAIMSMPPTAGVRGGGGAAVREMSRDAVAAIFGASGERLDDAAGAGLARVRRRAVLIDLRRHDERVLYGSINGSVHLPGTRRERETEGEHEAGGRH